MMSYNQHVKWRGECGRRFGTIRDLPIVKPTKIARDIIAKQHEAVLDFGSGVQKVAKSGYDILDDHYFSLDADPEGVFDYNSLNDIPDNKNFSFVIMNQVIEHIPFQECMKLMTQLWKFVSWGGMCS
jgi:hypothetical protein